MESTAMAEGHQQTIAILSQIECYLDDLIFSSDCDVVCGDITVGTLLKLLESPFGMITPILWNVCWTTWNWFAVMGEPSYSSL